jgi:DNA-binding response OmpR family regulator
MKEILLLEDQREILENLNEFLEMFGLNIFIIHNVEEGLRMALHQ